MTLSELHTVVPEVPRRTLQKWCETGVVAATRRRVTIRQPLGRGPRSGLTYTRTMMVWDVPPSAVRKLRRELGHVI